MNETETRAEFIDKQLEAVGWKTDVEVGMRVRREYHISDGEIRTGGMRAKNMKADYVLEYKHIKLAVIEAKSMKVDVSEGVAQAKTYAEKLQLPVSYAANGKEIYRIDHISGKEDKIKAFPSPEELWNYTHGKTSKWLDKFNEVPFEYMNSNKQVRYYQELAVNRVVEAVAEDKQRILLTLATGTGKTFIAFQIAWKLFKSRWTQQKDKERQPRILFLTDRNFLADQALRDFGAFDPAALVRITPGSIAKQGEVPTNGSVFFTIFQTFMRGTEDRPYFGEYAPDFFDLVIIDECHRGGADDESSWRAILDHFSSAVHLGLTATPKRKDNVDTYEYFGEPVYVYSLKEGIKDGFLTPFKVKRIRSTLDDYIYSSDDDVLEGEVEEGRIYEEPDFNTRIEIAEREQNRVQKMLAEINSDEKTIVFCANQAHAAKVRDWINQKADSISTEYCVRVTANDGSIGEQYLEQFKDNERNIPTILTTSRKLTTGVDARNIRNIVLMRPVNDMIEFKQIIGRGTRLHDDKFFFTVVDFVGAYRLFNDPDWDGTPVEDPDEGDGTGTGGSNEGDPVDDEGEDEEESKGMLRIKLSDGKVREIQNMVDTQFYLEGKLVSAQEFVQHLFEALKLPELFTSEQELREIWADPTTRSRLLDILKDNGCGEENFQELQKLIEPQDCDLFDLLEFVAYNKVPISRKTRVEASKSKILGSLNEKQREFIEFVLQNYIRFGIKELDARNVSDALKAKYKTLSDAERELDSSKEEIRSIFINFQKHLYQEAA